MCPSTEGINNRKLERTLCHVQGGWQLIQNNPFIYSANMPPASLAAKFPMLTRVMEGERPSAPPWYSITPITSQGGKTFTSFAKYRKYNQGICSLNVELH